MWGCLLFIADIAYYKVFPCASVIEKIAMDGLIGASIFWGTYKFAKNGVAKFSISGFAYNVGGSTALVVAFIIIGLIRKSANHNCENRIDLTVYVADKIGTYDPSSESGTLVLSYQHELKEGFPNPRGEVTFHKLDPNERIKFFFTHSEPFQLIVKDSLYSIPQSHTIYLEIKLKGIDKIDGMTYLDDRPVANAQISVGSQKKISDIYGKFTIQIPDSLQARTYKVQCDLPGVDFQELEYSPETGRELKFLLYSQKNN